MKYFVVIEGTEKGEWVIKQRVIFENKLNLHKYMKKTYNCNFTKKAVDRKGHTRSFYFINEDLRLGYKIGEVELFKEKK